MPVRCKDRTPYASATNREGQSSMYELLTQNRKPETNDSASMKTLKVFLRHCNHCRRKEIVSEGHDKEIFFEPHYFLRLQKQFLEKWGHMPPPPVPQFLQNITFFKD